jgi:hypothetical protein
MKSIKYLILLLFVSVTVAQAQQYRFETSGFMITQKTNKGKWDEWSKFNKTKMVVTLDADKNRIVVYSEVIQLFTILKYYDKKETKDGNVVSFQCVDNVGQNCEVSIFTRKDKGNLKQLYVYYKDRIVAYNMKLLKDKK